MTSSRYRGTLSCPRCGLGHDEVDAFSGCRACQETGVSVNLEPDYALDDPGLHVAAGERGVFRFRELLPLTDDVVATSLDEGRTPVVPLARLGASLGLSRLFLKDESRNPTWSYKDRLAAVAVTRAAADGADTVVVATTGNHGAAVAAYAAAAGLRCVALTLTSVPVTMLTLMQVYGAQVAAYESGPDRWVVMREGIEHRGWVPMSGFQNPPMGSNPFGVEGYKSIAYELWLDLEDAPDVVIAPTAYGDGLAGIARGFCELSMLGLTTKSTRLVAVDPFGAYAAALAAGADQPARVPAGSSSAFSVATPIGTYQGLHALRRSGGTAVGGLGDAEIAGMQARVAATEGLYLEAAAVLPIMAAGTLLRSGWLDPEETVVTLGTSTGLKDVGTTAARLLPPPVLPPSLHEFDLAFPDRDRGKQACSSV